MKQRLTKEQATHLINELYRMKGESAGYLAVNDNYELRVKDFEKIINQCTEKEFPKFLIRGSFDVMDSLEIALNSTVDDSQIYINGEVVLNHGDFKEFAKHVSEIVKWIEGQE